MKTLQIYVRRKVATGELLLQLAIYYLSMEVLLPLSQLPHLMLISLLLFEKVKEHYYLVFSCQLPCLCSILLSFFNSFFYLYLLLLFLIVTKEAYGTMLLYHKVRKCLVANMSLLSNTTKWCYLEVESMASCQGAYTNIKCWFLF